MLLLLMLLLLNDLPEHGRRRRRKDRLVVVLPRRCRSRGHSQLPHHWRQTGHEGLVVQGLEQELVEVRSAARRAWRRRRGRRHFVFLRRGLSFFLVD